MASPFRIFRKYLKPLMVVLGVLIMFSFVILDPLAKFLTGGRVGDASDPIYHAGAVAASWEGGSLTNQELESLMIRREIVGAFLEHVEGLGAQPALVAGLEPPPLRVMPVRIVERLVARAEDGVQGVVLRTKLLADAARDAGMSVDDNAIVQYLVELGRDRVTRDDMRKILEGLQSNNQRISIDYVFDGVRDQLLARNYVMSNLYAAQTVTPHGRWQDWLRVNDRVVVEAAAIPVESYLTDVKNPTDAELQKFFDEFKAVESGPDFVGDLELPSARPGFRVPRKIDVQFVQANFEELVTKTEGEVTDEEIATYYEENKDRFIKADTSLFDDLPGQQDAPKADDEPKTDVPATETPPAGIDDNSGKSDAPEAEATQSEAEEAAPATDGATTTDEAPADAAATENPPDQTPPAAPVDTPPAAEDGNENATPGEGDQSRRNGDSGGSQSVFRQVAFLQDEETQSDATEAVTPGDDSAAADAESTPAAEAAPPVEDAAPATEAAPSADPAAASDAPAPAAEKPKQYQPLEEVRDQIRVEIARQRAIEKVGTIMEEALGGLTVAFNSYFDDVLRAQSKKEERPAPKAALADLAPLAEKHGLTAGKTGPMTALEFRATPVGESRDLDTGLELLRILYGGTDRDLYQPMLTLNANDGDRYISMKTSDTPSRVPKLDEVHGQVLRAWKQREAAKIALKDAEKQAAQAQKAGSSLSDFYAEKPPAQVERVDPFSYLTRGDVPDQSGLQRFRISQPDGIVAAGPELLNKVFELKDGEVCAALNHDQSMAYIIRVVEHQDTPETLRSAYLAEANRWDGRDAMTEQHFIRSRHAILADIAGTDGIDWKGDQDKFGAEAEVAE